MAGASVQARASGRRPRASPARPIAMVRSVSSASVSSLTPADVARAPRGGTRRSRPGTVGMHSQHVEHPPVEVEADDVLDVLPAARAGPGGCRPWCCRRPRRPRGRRTARRAPAWRRGSKTVSPSTRTRMSWRAAAMPVLSAAGLPALACRIRRTFGQAQARDDRGRVVGRAVVDHDDLEVGIVAGRPATARVAAMPSCLVVRRHDHRDAGAGVRSTSAAAPVRRAWRRGQQQHDERAEQREHGERRRRRCRSPSTVHRPRAAPPR